MKILIKAHLVGRAARVVAGCGSTTHGAPRCQTNKRNEECVYNLTAAITVMMRRAPVTAAAPLVSHARSVCLLGGDQTGRAALFTSRDERRYLLD